jgi:hypothetical protein
MARPFSTAHAAAVAHAGAQAPQVRDWLRYTDRLVRRGIITPAPPSPRARREGDQVLRAEQWRGHRWVLTQRRGQ